MHEPPPTKKQRTKGKKKMTTAEKVTAGMMKAFLEYQEKNEGKFMKFEQLRAKEEREHKERLLRLIFASQQGNAVPRSSIPTAPHVYYERPNYNCDIQNDSFTNDY